MTYRGDFLLGTILRFLPMVTTILLWQAIYDGLGPDRSWPGFRYHEMIAYLLLTNISRMFSSMPGLAGGIAREIREGTLKRYLIQPIDMIGYLLVLSGRPQGRLYHHVVPALCACCSSSAAAIFDGFPDPPTLAAYAVSLVLAFLVGFFFEASVGMVGFWFLEVTSLLYIVMTLNFFISGHMLPLDLLPQPWSGLLKVLPFQYMAYFPAVVFLGKVKGMTWSCTCSASWSGPSFFIVLARGPVPAGPAALQRVRRLRPWPRRRSDDTSGCSAAWRGTRSTASWPSGATSWSRCRSRCSGWGSCSPSTGRSSRRTQHDRRLDRAAVLVLRRLLLRPERPDRDALPGELQRVRRAGPHRRPGLPAAQADRRAVPDHVPADRLGHGARTC